MSLRHDVLRALEASKLNEEAKDLGPEELRAKYGQLWDTAAMQRDYTVDGFAAPFVVVVRKSDGVKGTLAFSHNPRWYHSFKEA